MTSLSFLMFPEFGADGATSHFGVVDSINRAVLRSNVQFGIGTKGDAKYASQFAPGIFRVGNVQLGENLLKFGAELGHIILNLSNFPADGAIVAAIEINFIGNFFY